MARLLWTQKQDIGPRPRFAHAMAYDSARRRVVLFGGDALNGLRFQDTWEWDGSDWTQVQDMGPSPRRAHAMAYDSARNRTVLFGGRGAQDFDDTWEWDGESWTQVQNAGPDPRWGHAMAFDTARKRVVLFGGVAGAADDTFGDTWEWDGSDWSQADNTGPSARRQHAMTYDRVRSRTLLFGGVDVRRDGLSDTWEWDGVIWRQAADTGPAGAFGAAMAFRKTAATLFGGLSSSDQIPGRQIFGLTWEWDGRRWTARQDIGVGARFGHAMAFDSARSRVVLFGGLSVPAENADAANALKGDTWEHADEGTPPPIEPVVPSGPRITSLTATPNPIQMGQVLTVRADIGAPLDVPVRIQLDLSGVVGEIQLPAGITSGNATLSIPTVTALPVPFTVTLTARIDNGPVTELIVTIV